MKGSQRHSSLLTEPATFQCSFSFLENKINKKNFWLQLSHMAQNGAGGNSTPKPGLVFSLCGQQVLLPLFFIFISYIIKILWPFPEVSALKKNNEEGKQ